MATVAMLLRYVAMLLVVPRIVIDLQGGRVRERMAVSGSNSACQESGSSLARSFAAGSVLHPYIFAAGIFQSGHGALRGRGPAYQD